MRDYLYVGEAPSDESCAQVGAPDFPERNRAECHALINQLRRQLGPEPLGARLALLRESHDFGDYRSVVCYYEETDTARDYAFRAEAELPEEWDPQALEELTTKGFDPRSMPQ